MGCFQCSCMSFAGQVHSFILDTYIGVDVLNYEFGYMLGFKRYSQHFFQSDLNIFYSHKQGMDGSADLILSVFKILVILVDV